MLKVIKKDGRVVDFNPDKIKVSLGNCGSDIGQHLNSMDLDILAKDIEKKLILLRGEEGKTSSYEIISLVLETLHQMGFKKIANSYYNNYF